MQIPPLFSAKFVNGGRAYKLARRGVEMELAPSAIVIYEMELLSFNLPLLTIRIKCSKGTYIRSMARDFGVRLGSGAHLVELRRTAIGNLKVENAMSTDDFEKIIGAM
jgi:tRNA pseudouridine55 synthase